MDAVRVIRRISADTGETAGAWNDTEAKPPLVLELNEAIEASVGETGLEARAWVTGAGISGSLLSRDLVAKIQTEAAGFIPQEELAEVVSNRLEELLIEPVGTPVSLTRHEAAELARRLFGADPSLPSGSEYVERVRGDWSMRLPAS